MDVGKQHVETIRHDGPRRSRCLPRVGSSHDGTETTATPKHNILSYRLRYGSISVRRDQRDGYMHVHVDTRANLF